MASIKGWQLKGVKTFRGREWLIIHGNIYLNGKKVGWFNNDGNGGGADVDLCEVELWERLNADVREFYKHEPMLTYSEEIPRTAETFFYELLELMDLEKKYKKFSKKGYPYMTYYTVNPEGIDRKIVGYKTAEERMRDLAKIPVIDSRFYDKIEDFIID